MPNVEHSSPWKSISTFHAFSAEKQLHKHARSRASPSFELKQNSPTSNHNKLLEQNVTNSRIING